MKTVEDGSNQRTVVSEFDSIEEALKTYESSAYQSALKLLHGAAERDVRFVSGPS